MDFKALQHIHILLVAIFTIHYLIKGAMLLMDSPSLLAYRQKTKVPEMIISFLFLATGIYLAINTGNRGIWLWVKIGIVALSIPIAIIGFKKERKPMALLAMMCLVYAYGISETKSPTFKKEANKEEFKNVATVDLGKQIYEAKCMLCHGPDGKLGLSGAKDLTQSQLTPEQKIEIIRKGKNAMAAYETQLSEEEIKAVAEYVNGLK